MFFRNATKDVSRKHHALTLTSLVCLLCNFFKEFIHLFTDYNQ